MNNLPAMHFPLGARGNNFDSEMKIISSWSKRIPFASSGPFCACNVKIFFSLCTLPTPACHNACVCYTPREWNLFVSEAYIDSWRTLPHQLLDLQFQDHQFADWNVKMNHCKKCCSFGSTRPPKPP